MTNQHNNPNNTPRIDDSTLRLTASAGSAIPLKDMFEFASLDAMGLLDESERRAFEESFAKLPATVQEQIRAQQSRVADMNATLPEVEPPTTLRQRVIDAVMSEIEVGRPVVAARSATAFMKSRGVNPLWRAAAIGSLAAVIALGFTTLQMMTQYKALETGIANNTIQDVFLKEFGPKFERALLSNKTQFIQFAASSPAGAGRGEPMAVILLDPQTRTAQLFCKDLPENSGTYNLVLVDSSGRTSNVVLPFRAASSRVSETIENVELNKGATLSIIASNSDQPLLKSTNL